LLFSLFQFSILISSKTFLRNPSATCPYKCRTSCLSFCSFCACIVIFYLYFLFLFQLCIVTLVDVLVYGIHGISYAWIISEVSSDRCKRTLFYCRCLSSNSLCGVLIEQNPILRKAWMMSYPMSNCGALFTPTVKPMTFSINI
jgi:hypothetical protein